VIHYELILLYALGCSPGDVVRDFGYGRSTAYRFYRIYRLAGKQLTDRLRDQHSMPSSETKRGSSRSDTPKITKNNMKKFRILPTEQYKQFQQTVRS